MRRILRASAAVVAISIASLGAVSGSAEAGTAPATSEGFWLVDRSGAVSAHGVPDGLRTPDVDGVVGAAMTPDGAGLWVVTAEGEVRATGSAVVHGSTSGLALNAPVVGIAATPTGDGYWLVALDGGVFAFGDATFYGSTGDLALRAPVVNIAATPTGDGYWLVALDGGVFTFGDARFHGSMGGVALKAPVGSIVPVTDGYLLVALDGGIFTFGDAAFHGSLGGQQLESPIVAAVPTRSADGYWMASADGEVFAFGDATPITGRSPNRQDAEPIVALVTPWSASSGGGLGVLGLLPAPAPGAVTAVGDSILWVSTEEFLAAIAEVPTTVDAVIGRTFGEGLDVIRDLAAHNAIESTLLVHLGTNGGFTQGQLDELLALAGPQRRVLLVNLRIDRSFSAAANRMLGEAAASHDNVELVDWYATSNSHPELFISDGYHPSDLGIEVYVDLLTNAIRRT